MKTLILVIVFAVALPALGGAKPSLDCWKDMALLQEVRMVKKYDLTRFKDREELQCAIDQHLLVRVPDSGLGFQLDRRVGGRDARNRELYKYARPYTRLFIERLGVQYQEHSGDAIVVTSLVRTCEYQKRVAKNNSSAASCDKTSHATGATIDILARSIPHKHRAWLRGILLGLEEKGLILATEERAQPVFHVMILPKYQDYLQSWEEEVVIVRNDAKPQLSVAAEFTTTSLNR